MVLSIDRGVRVRGIIVLQLSKYFYWLLVGWSLSIGIIIVYWTHWSTPELVILG